MSKYSEGSVRTQGSRTGDPRKITEWQVRLPGGKDAKFEIHLADHEGLMVFVATSDHPWFTGFRVLDADMNLLREKLEESSRRRIEQEREGTWEAATLATFETTRRTDTEYPRSSLEFRLNMEEVEYMPGARVGNRGQTEIRTRYNKQTIVQRGPEDVFRGNTRISSEYAGRGFDDPDLRNWMSDPISRESEKPMSRLICPNGKADVDLLADTLERFFRGIEARMSPARRDLEGVLRPEELTAILQASLPSKS